MTGGNYSIAGGFWALTQIVETSGAPSLHISSSGNVVTIYWQNVSGWNLYQDNNLTRPAGCWSAAGTPTLSNGTNYLNLVGPVGNVFFRLGNP
jgi:hypothetical protein